jgi:hypothetical protein
MGNDRWRIGSAHAITAAALARARRFSARLGAPQLIVESLDICGILEWGVAPVSATPEQTRRLGAPLRAVEKRPLRGWPHDAASAGVCRTPVKHRFGNEAE